MLYKETILLVKTLFEIFEGIELMWGNKKIKYFFVSTVKLLIYRGWHFCTIVLNGHFWYKSSSRDAVKKWGNVNLYFKSRYFDLNSKVLCDSCHSLLIIYCQFENLLLPLVKLCFLVSCAITLEKISISLESSQKNVRKSCSIILFSSVLRE